MSMLKIPAAMASGLRMWVRSQQVLFFAPRGSFIFETSKSVMTGRVKIWFFKLKFAFERWTFVITPFGILFILSNIPSIVEVATLATRTSKAEKWISEDHVGAQPWVTYLPSSEYSTSTVFPSQQKDKDFVIFYVTHCPNSGEGGKIQVLWMR